MKHLLFAALLTVAFAALAGGCDLRGAEEPSRDGLLTRSLDGDEGEMTAILRGTLALDPDRGCVLLSGMPVVWPAETTLTADPPELRLPGGLTARTGDTITGGGGEVPAAAIRQTSIRVEGDLTSALECAPAESKVAVLSARGDQITVSRASYGVSPPFTLSSDRMRWQSELGRFIEVSDPALVRQVDEAANASGARVFDISVLARSLGQHIPVVTLESTDPASYMKHDLRGFLDRIGYFEPDGLAFVELFDEEGRFAWAAGRFPSGGWCTRARTWINAVRLSTLSQSRRNHHRRARLTEIA
ncbi:MAG: hypothetical protein ACR2M2_06330 [Gaiellaceae bacterium]